jgi:hypothetical protein
MLVQKVFDKMGWACETIGCIINTNKILKETPLIKISYWDTKETET